jgi:hypothetical protein
LLGKDRSVGWRIDDWDSKDGARPKATQAMALGVALKISLYFIYFFKV